MRDLAEYILRGRKQAVIVAMLGTLIPMMFWLSASVVALVTLRVGLSQGCSVLLWALIPALGWWLGSQHPGPLIVLLTVVAMAGVLRVSVSWSSTLVVGSIVSLASGLLVPLLLPEVFDAMVVLLGDVFRQLAESAGAAYEPMTEVQLRALSVASFTSTYLAISVGSLCLARSWQAKLFKPGAWQQEFYQIRLSKVAALGLVLVFALASLLELNAELVQMVAAIPAVVCGLALVHGVIAKKKLGGQWLFGFYFFAVLLFPALLDVLAILAVLDSWVDFRGRIQGSQDA